MNQDLAEEFRVQRRLLLSAPGDDLSHYDLLLLRACFAMFLKTCERFAESGEFYFDDDEEDESDDSFRSN
jgi:hypothetical protein